MSTDPASTRPFNELGLPTALVESVNGLGYEIATPIQSQAIPPLLKGDDIVGIAQTGTGKTAAFALPTLANLQVNLRKPQVLVLCPTRELSLQVADAYRSYAKTLKGVRVLAICGGADMRQQLRSLKDGVHVVVATPGRMLDHIRRKSISFSAISAVVLDEADEMLRMGFIDDVDAILEATPSQRTVALFSATMPPRVRDIAQKHLRSPTEVTINSVASTNHNIEQYHWLAKGTNKLDALDRLLAYEETDGVIVFVRTRESTSAISEQLRQRGYRSAALNGDMEQKQRVKTVEQLKRGHVDILVATDVAARGLDVNRITHVVNYDIPFDEEAYVHRIGRTGRAGRTGKAILFVAPRERRLLRNIERLTRQEIPALKLPSIGAIDRKRQAEFADSIRQRLTEPHEAHLEFLLDELCQSEGCTHRDIALVLAGMLETGKGAKGAKKKDRSEDAFSDPASEDSRASSGFKQDRGDKTGKGKKATKRDSTAHDLGEAQPLKDHPDVPMERFRMEVGRKHGVKKGEIMGCVANEAGIEGEFIGTIAIFEDCSTIDLPEGMPKAILRHLKKARVKGQNLAMTRVTGKR